LLIGNDGEKYSPEGIEESIVDKSPFIQQAMLYNNQNPFTVGMLVPEIETINRELKKQGIEPGSEAGNRESLNIISGEIKKYKKGGMYEGEFPERWLPANLVILPEAFTQENNLLNASMKMVRGKITERYSRELNFIFTPEAKNIENDVNLEAIKKWNS
jgi:long-chain acyl-CoA synthetase